MAWKAITAKELVAGTNSLKIWSTGGVSGTIKKIRVYTSEEAGLLNQSFNSDGSLSTNAQSPAISNQQSTPIIRAITAEQATLTEVKARAYADGMVTEAEARAIEAAQAKADLAEITASAYADGIVSDEEARAIADAQAKADAAQAAAEVTAAADAMKVYDLTASHVVPLSTDINGADEWEFSVDEIFCDGSLVFVEYEGDGVLEIALNDSHLTVERIVNTSDYGDIDTGFVFSDEPEVEYIDLAMANGTGSYEYGGL